MLVNIKLPFSIDLQTSGLAADFTSLAIYQAIKTIKSLKAVAYQFATETFQAIETIILDFKNATNFTGVVIFRTASKKIIMVIRILFIEVIHILFMKFNRIFY